MKKSLNKVATSLFIAVAMTMSACGSDDDLIETTKIVVPPTETPSEPKALSSEDAPVSLELSPAERQVGVCNNQLAFNLLRKARDSKNSLVLSPLSITCDLAMLSNGATGETLRQILQVLGFEHQADMNSFCRKMLTTAATLDEQTKVLMANSIFANTDRGCSLQPDFVALSKAFYDAELQSRSFGDGQTLEAINRWASEHTEGMIEKILTEDEFKSSTLFYLLNAVYFKGGWQMKFDEQLTQMEEFNHAGNTKELTMRPMMHQQSNYYYYEDEECQMVRLPYGNGNYEMSILLPREHVGLDNMAETLTAEHWQQMMQQAIPYPVDLKLPRFKTDSSLGLVNIMKELGMPNAFEPEKAEFPLFCTCKEPVFISLMKQVAKLCLDEEGTEASAVTVIGMANSCGPGDTSSIDYIPFYANRPFLYVISEQTSGAIFFIGQYTGY